jgi:hypothetical protein
MLIEVNGIADTLPPHHLYSHRGLKPALSLLGSAYCGRSYKNSSLLQFTLLANLNKWTLTINLSMIDDRCDQTTLIITLYFLQSVYKVLGGILIINTAC